MMKSNLLNLLCSNGLPTRACHPKWMLDQRINNQIQQRATVKVV